MLCVIPHIIKDAKYHSDSDHRKKVNNVINTLFSGASEEEMAVILDLFWADYIALDNMIGSFDADEFILKIKDIRDGNSHLWHKNIHFLSPMFLVLLYVESHKRFLVFGASERSWGDVKKIKSSKTSSTSSGVSEKQSIVYTSTCIESDRIEQYHSDKQIHGNCSSRTWNKEDYAFDHQLDKWGMERVLS